MHNESSHLTQAILAELGSLNKVVTDDVSQRSKAKKTLADLVKALEQNDVDAIARLLASRTRQLAEIYPQAETTLEKLHIDLNRRQEEQLHQTFSQLEGYCRAEGIPLKSNPPKFTVEHFIEVEFDRRKHRAKVGNQSLSTMKWSSVREALETERARLWKRPFEASNFRQRLIQAYEYLERLNPSPTGWVALEEVYQILKQQAESENPNWRKSGRLVAYYKDEFGADLSKLWQTQALKRIDPPYIELSAIRDPRRAYKVLQPDSNIGLYGFLRPREV